MCVCLCVYIYIYMLNMSLFQKNHQHIIKSTQFTKFKIEIKLTRKLRINFWNIVLNVRIFKKLYEH